MGKDAINNNNTLMAQFAIGKGKHMGFNIQHDCNVSSSVTDFFANSESTLNEHVLEQNYFTSLDVEDVDLQAVVDFLDHELSDRYGDVLYF